MSDATQATDDLNLAADSDGTGNGDIIFWTGSGASRSERARIRNNGTGTGLLGGSLSSIFNVKTGYNATGDGVTDDTVAIQAALTAANAAGGGHVYVPRGTFIISSPLTIYSNTILECDAAVTIRLKAGSDCNMLRSQAAYGTGRDSEIDIIGGTWDRGANNGAAAKDRHSIVFRKVDRCSIRDCAFLSSNGKFQVLFQNCTYFLADNHDMRAVSSDGIHVEGPASNGTISNIRGSCGDDMVALTAKDYAAYTWGDEGDITDILIDGVFGNATSKAIVRIIGGNALNTRRIGVRNVFGSSATTPVVVGDDTADANTVGGLLDEIFVDGVRARSTNNSGQVVLISASLGKKIAVSRITWDAQTNTAQNAVKVAGTSVSVQSLTVDGVHVISACANDGSAVWVDAGTTVTDLAVTNVTGTWTGASGSSVVLVNGTVTDLGISNIVGSPASGFHSILKMADAITTGNVARLSIANVAMTWSAASGAVIRAIHASHTLPSVQITNVVAAGVSWLLDTATTVKVGVSAVTVPNGVFNVRTGGAVTALVDQSCSLPNTNTLVGTLVAPGISSKRKATPTYSASITPDATLGEWQTITVTNGTAFTINAPIIPPSSTTTSVLTIEISNTSGGAMGVITWNAAFKFVGLVWANPATANKRFARFEWNGAAWICTGLATADYT